MVQGYTSNTKADFVSVLEHFYVIKVDLKPQKVSRNLSFYSHIEALRLLKASSTSREVQSSRELLMCLSAELDLEDSSFPRIFSLPRWANCCGTEPLGFAAVWMALRTTIGATQMVHPRRVLGLSWKRGKPLLSEVNTSGRLFLFAFFIWKLACFLVLHRTSTDRDLHRDFLPGVSSSGKPPRRRTWREEWNNPHHTHTKTKFLFLVTIFLGGREVKNWIRFVVLNIWTYD